MNSYIYTGNELFLVVDCTPYTIENSHPRFTQILDAIKKNCWDEIPSMISVAKAVNAFGNNKVVVDEDAGVVRYNGEVLHNSLTDRIIWMMRDGFSIDPFVKFVENLMQNPSKKSVDELYTFLEYGGLPITEDGHFLAYKRVRANYTDVHSGTFDNSVGKVVTMERNQVDDRSDNCCSTGLHFCSLEYLKDFSGEHVMILKINPRDVVSIPTDYNNTKGRCCRYEVVGEYKGALTDPAFTKSVYLSTEDGSADLDIQLNETEDSIDEEHGYADGYDAFCCDDVHFDNSDLEDAEGTTSAVYIRSYLEGVAKAKADSEANDSEVSQDYIEGYVKGHKEGRKRETPEYEKEDLAVGGPFEGDDYGRGYVDGYADGKSHKARQYTSADIDLNLED